MKKYIGTKTVEAEPLSMGEAYNQGLLQVGRAPNEAEKSKPGFRVKYEGGYVSWSPAEVFEQAYKLAETPLDRMQIEGVELSGKQVKLHAFISSEKFEELDDMTKAMLVVQDRLMQQYRYVLDMRYLWMGSGEGGFSNLSFSIALILLTEGFVIRRAGWNGKGLVVFKQVPAHIESSIIPKMQSLPQYAKDRILNSKGFIDYTSQCLIFNEETGRADSWVPSISDIFAEDWEVVFN